MGAAYGSYGIYGRDETSEGELEFGGARTQPLEHGADVTSDHTLVLYRLPDAPDGSPAAALRLWSAVDVADTDGTVERVGTAVDLPGDGASMSIYDPGGDHRADRTDAYTIGTARLDIAGLSATMPLPAGTVSLDPERTAVGDAGGYAPLWTGSHDGTVARGNRAGADLVDGRRDGRGLTRHSVASGPGGVTGAGGSAPRRSSRNARSAGVSPSRSRKRSSPSR